MGGQRDRKKATDRENREAETERERKKERDREKREREIVSVCTSISGVICVLGICSCC